jgi:hypothetical protein
MPDAPHALVSSIERLASRFLQIVRKQQKRTATPVLRTTIDDTDTVAGEA